MKDEKKIYVIGTLEEFEKIINKSMWHNVLGILAGLFIAQFIIWLIGK